MNIDIPAYVIIFLIVLILNICIGFGKRKLLNICYIIISFILAILGLIGMIVTRPLLVSRLERNLASGRLESDRIAWVMNKYDTFTIVSMIITCLLCLSVIFLLIITRKHINGMVWNSVSGVVYMSRSILVIAALVYSYGTINKEFDVASYLFTIAIAETLVLYIPIVVKRIILLKFDLL